MQKITLNINFQVALSFILESVAYKLFLLIKTFWEIPSSYS